MNKVKFYLRVAARNALGGIDPVKRSYMHGAVGIRCDGATVNSRNKSTRDRDPSVHAEARLCKKLDFGSVVYVARVNRLNEICNSRPCDNCQRAMILKGVKKCYYSINAHEYGCITF